MIVGLLLAAGKSARFGADKLTAKLNGKAVVRWSAESLMALGDVYVVIPPGADQLTQALARMDVTFVVNLARAEGMASSFRAGISALPVEVEAVVVALGDQPLASSAVTAALVARWAEGGVDAVAPVYGDGRGHPVLFGRACFPALGALRGDVGARSVLDALGDRLAPVRVDGDAPLDVDTPDALAQLAASRGAGLSEGRE